MPFAIGNQTNFNRSMPSCSRCLGDPIGYAQRAGMVCIDCDGTGFEILFDPEQI